MTRGCDSLGAATAPDTAMIRIVILQTTRFRYNCNALIPFVSLQKPHLTAVFILFYRRVPRRRRCKKAGGCSPPRSRLAACMPPCVCRTNLQIFSRDADLIIMNKPVSFNKREMHHTHGHLPHQPKAYTSLEATAGAAVPGIKSAF